MKNIHVNQHVIRANKKHGKNDPVITIKEGSKIVYGGNDKPLLNCGARVVIQTNSEINIIK